jgi:hypothetical protein
VPSFIKEHQSANISLKNLLSMEDSKNPTASHSQGTTTSQNKFLSLYFTNEKL